MLADLGCREAGKRAFQRAGPFQGVLTVDVLHHQLELRVDLIDFVKRHDAMMALAARHQQVPKDLHLTPEVLIGLVSDRTVCTHHLDGDRTVLRQLPGPEDLAHATTADPFLDQIVGIGLGELQPPRLAILAKPDDTGLVTGEIRARLRTIHRILDRDSLTAARTGRHRLAIAGALGEMHGERAISCRDDVPFAELDPLDA